MNKVDNSSYSPFVQATWNPERDLFKDKLPDNLPIFHLNDKIAPLVISDETKTNLRERIKEYKPEQYMHTSTKPRGGICWWLLLPVIGWIVYGILWKLNNDDLQSAEKILRDKGSAVTEQDLDGVIKSVNTDIKPRLNLHKAKHLIEKGEFDKAIEALKSIRSDDAEKETPSYHYLSALAKVGMGELEEANSCFLSAITRSEPSDESLKIYKEDYEVYLDHLCRNKKWQSPEDERSALDISVRYLYLQSEQQAYYNKTKEALLKKYTDLINNEPNHPNHFEHLNAIVGLLPATKEAFKDFANSIPAKNDKACFDAWYILTRFFIWPENSSKVWDPYDTTEQGTLRAETQNYYDKMKSSNRKELLHQYLQQHLNDCDAILQKIPVHTLSEAYIQDVPNAKENLFARFGIGKGMPTNLKELPNIYATNCLALAEKRSKDNDPYAKLDAWMMLVKFLELRNNIKLIWSCNAKSNEAWINKIIDAANQYYGQIKSDDGLKDHLRKYLDQFIRGIYQEKTSTILTLLVEAAHQGTPLANYKLGQLAYEGCEELPKNRSTALKYFERSAEAGGNYAYTDIGLCYWNKDATIQNDKLKAYAAWRKGAAKDVTDCMRLLAECYEDGIAKPTVEKPDPNKRADWLIQPDPELAIEWYRKAIAKGAKVRAKLGPLEALYPQFAENCGPSWQDSNAKATAQQLFDKGMEHTKAKEYELALGYFNAAAQAGELQGLRNVGAMLTQQEGVKENPHQPRFHFDRGLQCLYQAAAAGNKSAMHFLGTLFSSKDERITKHLRNNIPHAIKWYRKAEGYGTASTDALKLIAQHPNLKL